MKRFTITMLLVLVAALTTASAHAGIMYQDPWTDPFDSGSGGEPTTTACTAYAQAGQKCKECKYTHNLDGSVLAECKLRSYSNVCQCYMAAGCEGRGTCTYK